tara:strand:- start:73 stop:471 length:399 start_codon:yes stop_codon:yes gene_type:complete
MKRTTRITRITNVFVAIYLLTMISSCTTFKSFLEADAGYAGNYEFLVKDTPDGDYTGTLTIRKGDNGYEGKLFTEGTNYEILNLQIENNKMTGNFTFQYVDLYFQVEFTGENFSGLIFADGQGFELTGTKVK